LRRGVCQPLGDVASLREAFRDGSLPRSPGDPQREGAAARPARL